MLEAMGRSVAAVDSIVGQSRWLVTFEGCANHAGTTPMNMRRDALCGAAEWIVAVERAAQTGVTATTGAVEVRPNAANVIPGSASVSLDVRHPDDGTRREFTTQLVEAARAIAHRRNLVFTATERLDQPAVPLPLRAMDFAIPSGAGHDAMIVARHMPAGMLFLRSPRGLSHHPDENVLAEDVAAALEITLSYIGTL